MARQGKETRNGRLAVSVRRASRQLRKEQDPEALRKQEQEPASALRKQEQEPAGTLRKEQEPGSVTRPLAVT